VGGFGASGYLQARLQESLELRKIKMHRPDPDKSWTAVVQGAVSQNRRNAESRFIVKVSANVERESPQVIYGIEKVRY
jgi:hypothetical protein